MCRGAYVAGHEPDGPQRPARRPASAAAAGRRAQPPHRPVGARARRLGAPLDVTVPRGRHLLPRPGLQSQLRRLPDDELCLGRSARRVRGPRRRGRRPPEPLVEAVAVADAVLRAGHATNEACRRASTGPAGCEGCAALARPCAWWTRAASRRRRAACGCSSCSAVCRGPVVQHDVYGPTDTWGERTCGSTGSCSSSTAATSTCSPAPSRRTAAGRRARRAGAGGAPLHRARRVPPQPGGPVRPGVPRAGRGRSRPASAPDRTPSGRRHRPLPAARLAAAAYLLVATAARPLGDRCR